VLALRYGRFEFIFEPAIFGSRALGLILTEALQFFQEGRPKLQCCKAPQKSSKNAVK